MWASMRSPQRETRTRGRIGPPQYTTPAGRPSASDLARALGSSALALTASAWNALRAGHRETAERQADSAIASWTGERQVGMAWLVRGACRLHRGEAAGALADLHEARRILGTPPADGDEPLDPWQLEEVDAFIGIALLDCGRPSEAEHLLSEPLARLESSPASDRRWSLVALQVAGSLHRERVLLGDLPGARGLLERVVLGAATVRAERARSLGDLAEVLRRGGDVAGASERLEAARCCLADVAPVVHALVYLAAAGRLAGPTRPWAREIGRRLAASPGIDEAVASLTHAVAEGRADGWASRSPY